MSIVNFVQRLNELEATAARTEGKLDQLRNGMSGARGPMDQLREEAEKTGSAIGNIGGQIVEMISLAQDNWTPALRGVVWDMYEITREMEKAQGVSREILDKVAGMMDEKIPQFDLWTKHLLALAEQGKLSFDELMARLEAMLGSADAAQLNSMFRNDIPGFLLELRRLQKGIDETAETTSKAARKVKESADAVSESARKTTHGMTSQGSTSDSIGARSLGDPRDAEGFGTRLYQSIEAAKRR